MRAMKSQTTDVSIVCSIAGSGTNQRKHQNSASLAFVCEIHRWPANSPHKRPVTRKMFPLMTSSRSFILCNTYSEFADDEYATWDSSNTGVSILVADGLVPTWCQQQWRWPILDGIMPAHSKCDLIINGNFICICIDRNTGMALTAYLMSRLLFLLHAFISFHFLSCLCVCLLYVCILAKPLFMVVQ